MNGSQFKISDLILGIIKWNLMNSKVLFQDKIKFRLMKR